MSGIGRRHSRPTWMAGAALLILLALSGVGGAGAATQGRTALGALAASMAPGTWAQLTTNNVRALYDTGSSGHILTYSSSLSWDPGARRMHFIGNDHHGGSTAPEAALKWVYYDDATNAWVRATPAPPNWPQHGDDHLTIDPSARVLYLLKGNGGNDPVDASTYSLASGGTWQALPPAPAAGYLGGTIGTHFFPGVGYVVHNSGEPGGEVRLRDLSGTWSRIAGFGGAGGYACVAEGSPRHDVVVFGGGSMNMRLLWRLNADRTVTPMPNSPVDIVNSPGKGIMAADPVTGHFIAWGNEAGGLWELDPRGAGTWRALATPPPPTLDGWQSAVVGAVPDYGVLMYVSARGQNVRVHLYKHAAGSAPPPSGDSDADGLPDAWETQYFGNLNQTGGGDPDADGATNAQEYAAGTDPTIPPATPPPAGGTAPSGGREGDEGCGALGLEALFIFGVSMLMRKRVPWKG